MISGTKISQLSVVASLQDTDFFPLQRGVTTNRISGLTLNNTTLNTVRANFPISYTSNVFLLSSADSISLRSNNVNITTNTLTLTGSQVIETNSLSSALRITQTGLGNALVVEDSTNPDNTPFVVTSAGNVGIGLTAPTNKLHIHSSSSNNSSNAHIKLTQTTNANESYIASDAAGVIRIGGRAGIGFVTDTAGEVVTVLSAGRVGIGTNMPNETLTVIGNISANDIYGNFFGNAGTATRWATPRLVTLSGATYGSTILDGTQNVTINTLLSTGVIIDQNIADNANISDVKLGTIATPGKVSLAAIDYSGTSPNQVLMTTGSAVVWQTLSSTEFAILPGSITSSMLGNNIVTEEKIADNAVTTTKLSAESVTTSKLLDEAVTTAKISNGAVTVEKAYAFASAVSNSIVSRDSNGNLSATEVTANLKGNANTATALQSPITLELVGDVTGDATFNGSQSVSLTTTIPSIPIWAVYAANILDSLSATYTQGDNNTQSETVLITQQISSVNVKSMASNFIQQNNTISFTLTLTSIPFEDPETYFTYNLLSGTSLTAIFTNQQAITGTLTPLPSGIYTIQTTTQDITSTTTAAITLSTSLTQYITGGIQILFNETTIHPPHGYLPGHVVNVTFLTGAPLSGGSFVTQPSGLYFVIDVPDTRSILLSTSTYQSASGQIILHRCTLRDSLGVSNVTYIEKGNHILNFTEPFVSPFYYGFAGSAADKEITGMHTSSIQRNPLEDFQDQLNLTIRTILNDGSLKLYDFNRTHVICFGD